MRTIRLILAIVLLFSTTSFIGCGGGGAKVDATGTTVGQELMDLEKAYNEGVITEKQYKEQKKKILKR